MTDHRYIAEPGVSISEGAPLIDERGHTRRKWLFPDRGQRPSRRGRRLYWEGRLNDIIKTGGANVSPLKIDEIIAADPAVRISQTVGVPHETLGEIVVSCIVPYGQRQDQDVGLANLGGWPTGSG